MTQRFSNVLAQVRYSPFAHERSRICLPDKGQACQQGTRSAGIPEKRKCSERERTQQNERLRKRA